MTIVLNRKKLLGFRIAAQGAKIGEKSGGKRGFAFGAKLGTKTGQKG